MDIVSKLIVMYEQYFESSSSSSSSDEDFDQFEAVLKLMPATERETVRRLLNFEREYVSRWSEEEVSLVLGIDCFFTNLK
jgi:Mg/Co/Ni transporter MgtE